MGDPSLRLKSGCAQDDAANQKKFKLSHYPIMLVLVISIGFLVPKAAAQSDKYSKMAPVDQYLMERNAEIPLARSAGRWIWNREGLVVTRRSCTRRNEGVAKLVHGAPTLYFCILRYCNRATERAYADHTSSPSHSVHPGLTNWAMASLIQKRSRSQTPH